MRGKWEVPITNNRRDLCMLYFHKFNRFILISLALLSLSISSSAQSAVIDFQDVSSGSCAGQGNSVTSRGFNFTGNSSDPALWTCDAGVIGNNTSAALIDANSLSIVTMTAADSSPFSLQSFYAGSRMNYQQQTVSSYYGLSTGIDVVGTKAAGGTVTQSFNFNYLDFDKFTLSLGFQGLSSVKFTSIGGGRTEFLIDDITVNPVAARPSVVPVPAAVWLFGTALIGLVGFGKRKSKIAA